MKTPTLSQQLMNEPIHLPGVCDIIVTRGFAYQWLKETGCDPSTRGFGSLDYMVFGAPKSSLPLTDLADPSTAAFMANVKIALMELNA